MENLERMRKLEGGGRWMGVCKAGVKEKGRECESRLK